MHIHFNSEKIKQAQQFAIVLGLVALVVIVRFSVIDFNLLYLLVGAFVLFMVIQSFQHNRQRLAEQAVIFDFDPAGLTYNYADHAGLKEEGTVTIPYQDLQSVWIDGENILDLVELKNDRVILSLNTDQPGYFDHLPKADDFAVDNAAASLNINLFEISLEDKNRMVHKFQDILGERYRRTGSNRNISQSPES